MSHAGHSATDPGSADAPIEHDHDSGSMPGGDCCEDMSCDCGCAVPHAVTLPASLPRTSWNSVISEFAFSVKSFHTSSPSTPFRPPA